MDVAQARACRARLRWRCWARKALYIAPPNRDTPKDRRFRSIDLTWYVRDSLGPTADTLLAGLDECREFPRPTVPASST
jgi:hypothetical protein